MEVEAALRVGLLRLRRLVALVLRVELALENVLGVGERVRIDRPALDVPHRKSLHRARGAELVTATRKDRVVEAAARKKCRRDRHAEGHRERHRLWIPVALGPY